MNLNLHLTSPSLSGFAAPRFCNIHESSPQINNTTVLLHSLLKTASTFTRVPTTTSITTRASLSESENDVVEDSSVSEIFDEELLSRISLAKDANEALDIVFNSGRMETTRVVSVSDCRMILNAAICRGNTDLALSIFYAMRCSFDQGINLRL